MAPPLQQPAFDAPQWASDDANHAPFRKERMRPTVAAFVDQSSERMDFRVRNGFNRLWRAKYSNRAGDTLYRKASRGRIGESREYISRKYCPFNSLLPIGPLVLFLNCREVVLDAL